MRTNPLSQHHCRACGGRITWGEVGWETPNGRCESCVLQGYEAPTLFEDNKEHK